MQWEAVPAMGGGGGPVGARGLRTLAAGDAMLDFPTRNYHYRVEGHRGEEAARAVRSFSASIFSIGTYAICFPNDVGVATVWWLDRGDISHRNISWFI